MYVRRMRATMKGTGGHTQAHTRGSRSSACMRTGPVDTAPTQAHTCQACKTSPAQESAGGPWVPMCPGAAACQGAPHPSLLPCQSLGWGLASGTAPGACHVPAASPRAAPCGCSQGHEGLPQTLRFGASLLPQSLMSAPWLPGAHLGSEVLVSPGPAWEGLSFLGPEVW